LDYLEKNDYNYAITDSPPLSVIQQLDCVLELNGSSCNDIEFVEVIDHPGWKLSIILVCLSGGFLFGLE
jgi:hypothetical protein